MLSVRSPAVTVLGTVHPRRSEIFGTVTDADQAPVGGVTVELLVQKATGQWEFAHQTVSDALGQFRFLGLRPSAYRLRATLADHAATYWPGVTLPTRAWSSALPPATTYLVDITPR